MKNSNYDDKEDGALKTVLEKKFNELNKGNEEAPTELKQEVFNTLNSLIMVGDMVDLFTVKFARTEMSLLDPSITEEWEEGEDEKSA